MTAAVETLWPSAYSAAPVGRAWRHALAVAPHLRHAPHVVDDEMTVVLRRQLWIAVAHDALDDPYDTFAFSDVDLIRARAAAGAGCHRERDTRRGV